MIVLYRILLNACTICYVGIGQWIADKTVQLIENKLPSIKDSTLDKFSGMDLEFLLTQVSSVKLVFLVSQISLVMSLCLKFLNFRGIVDDRVQTCAVFETLTNGPKLRFFNKVNEDKSYEMTMFITVEFIVNSVARVLKLILPLTIMLFVYMQLQRAEIKQRIEIDSTAVDARVR